MHTKIAFSYPSQVIPPAYICSRCKTPGLKLWRQYNTPVKFIELIYTRCADPALKVERDGTNLDEYKRRSDQITDRIGTEVAAQPLSMRACWPSPSCYA